MKENRSMLGVLLVAVLLITSCAQRNSVCSDKCKAKKESKKEVKMESTNDYNASEQLVCKLIGEELREKKELLKKEIFSQVKEVKEVSSGYILKFDDKNDILLKLTDYVMVEKECCPFFTFDFNVQPNAKGVSLKISGSDGAKEMLKPLINEIHNIK
jgi:hypothetical protein